MDSIVPKNFWCDSFADNYLFCFTFACHVLFIRILKSHIIITRVSDSKFVIESQYAIFDWFGFYLEFSLIEIHWRFSVFVDIFNEQRLFFLLEFYYLIFFLTGLLNFWGWIWGQNKYQERSFDSLKLYHLQNIFFGFLCSINFFLPVAKKRHTAAIVLCNINSCDEGSFD